MLRNDDLYSNVTLAKMTIVMKKVKDTITSKASLLSMGYEFGSDAEREGMSVLAEINEMDSQLSACEDVVKAIQKVPGYEGTHVLQRAMHAANTAKVVLASAMAEAMVMRYTTEAYDGGFYKTFQKIVSVRDAETSDQDQGIPIHISSIGDSTNPEVAERLRALQDQIVMKRLAESLRTAKMDNDSAAQTLQSFIGFADALAAIRFASAETSTVKQAVEDLQLVTQANKGDADESQQYVFEHAAEVQAARVRIDQKEHKLHKAMTEFDLGKELLGTVDRALKQVKTDEPQLHSLTKVCESVTQGSVVSSITRADAERRVKYEISNKAAMIEVVKQVNQIMEATSTFFKEKHKQKIER